MLVEAPSVNFKSIERFYKDRSEKYGWSFKGAGWSSPIEQSERFRALSNMLPFGEYSLNDYGCGSGGLLDFLSSCHKLPSVYHGIDTCISQIKRLQIRLDRYKLDGHAMVSSHPITKTDFTVASGTFNVMLGNTEKYWEEYVEDRIAMMDIYSSSGFGFNLLSGEVGVGLYRSTPGRWIELCEKLGGCTLLSYPPGNFTILVRKRRVKK